MMFLGIVRHLGQGFLCGRPHIDDVSNFFQLSLRDLLIEPEASLLRHAWAITCRNGTEGVPRKEPGKSFLP
jgi:hypothetical protein